MVGSLNVVAVKPASNIPAVMWKEVKHILPIRSLHHYSYCVVSQPLVTTPLLAVKMLGKGLSYFCSDMAALL